MTNDVLKIIELTNEKVICSVNVTDPLQVAQNPAYKMNDAYVTIWREYEGRAGWDGLRMSLVDKDGNCSTFRTMICTGVRFELVMSIVRDVEHLLNQKGLSLYGKSMKPYKEAQVSAVYGNRWWGTLRDEFGKELNVKCVGKQSEMSWNTALSLMLDRYNIPYYGTEHARRYDAYTGPRPTTNCTYYIYDVDAAQKAHDEEAEQED